MKCLQETRVGRTVNNLRKHDGIVGHKASVLVAKWKRQVVVENADSSDKYERLYEKGTENVEPGTRNNYTESQENCTHSTPNSDSRDLTASCSTDSNTSKFSCSGKQSSENCDEKMFESQQSSSSISRSVDARESGSSAWSEYSNKKTQNSKREDCGKTNERKRRRESDLIDIDCTMGASFADALGMLDMLSTSKAKKLLSDKFSFYSKASTSSKHKTIGTRSPFDKTPILLTKRPQLLELPLDIAVEPEKPQLAFRQPKKRTTQLTDEVTTNIISRTAKTKVFSGNKVGFKCKVPTLFEMCIKILQENVDCEYHWLRELFHNFIVFFCC